MTEHTNTRHDRAVIFVVGKGRSGSTLLGDVLGSVPGFFHAGELDKLWSHGLLGTNTCSCGERFEACPMWSDVFADLRRSPDTAWIADAPQSMVSLQRRVLSWRTVFTGGPSEDDLARYLAAMTALYDAIARATGARVIVDTSKWPAVPSLVQGLPGRRTLGIQLVRDSRAVAHSWRRLKIIPDTGEAMPRFGPLHTVASWTLRNLAAESTARKAGERMIRLRYEDFVDAPEESVRRLVAWTGADDVALPFLEDGAVEFVANHTAMGNPRRFERGPIRIRGDDAWRDELGRFDRLVVTAGTAPLLRRYGYPIRTSASRRESTSRRGSAS